MLDLAGVRHCLGLAVLTGVDERVMGDLYSPENSAASRWNRRCEPQWDVGR